MFNVTNENRSSTKAIGIPLHNIREALDWKGFELFKISSEQNLPNFFTKFLLSHKLHHLVKTFLALTSPLFCPLNGMSSLAKVLCFSGSVLVGISVFS